MAITLAKPRVKQATTYDLSNTRYQLGSAPSGYTAFTSAYATTDYFTYWATSTDDSKWEYGIGHWADVSGTNYIIKDVVVNSSGSFANSESVTVTVGPDHISGPFTGIIIRHAYTGWTDANSGPVTSFDTVVDPLSLWNGNPNYYFTIPTWVGAFRITLEAFIQSYSNATFAGVATTYDSGFTDGDSAYVDPIADPLSSYTSPISVRTSVHDYIQFLYATDETTSISGDFEASVEFWTGVE